MNPLSRGAERPSCAKNMPVEKPRAQGMPDARCTRGRLCSKKAQASATRGTPQSSGIPCAMVLTAYSALSPVTGLFCHRRLRDA
jgi:hypothetical protein